MRRAHLLWMGTAASVSWGCSMLLKFDGFGDCVDGACSSSAQPDASGSSTPPDASPGESSTGPVCTPKKWPSPPDAGPGPGGATLVFAMKDVAFARELDGGTTVYDVNNRCVCPGGIVGAGTCRKDAAVTCDDPTTGADNEFVDLYDVFSKFQSVFLSDTEVNKSIAKGDATLLVRVDDYEGTPDDGRVTVSLYNAVRVDADGGSATPTFLPNEKWVADRGSLIGGNALTPKYVDDKAYVTGGILVARFPDAEIRLATERLQRFRIVTTDLRLVWPIAVDGGRSVGEFVGRIHVQSLVEILGVLGWCPGTPQFIAVLTMCARADVNASDDTGNLPCDSLSAQFRASFTPSQKPDSFESETFAVSMCPDAGCR